MSRQLDHQNTKGAITYFFQNRALTTGGIILPQFDRSQTEEYMAAHLEYAQGASEIFTEKAVDEIYRYSAGSARAVNKVATHALMFAAQRAKKLIDDHMIRTVIEGELP